MNKKEIQAKEKAYKWKLFGIDLVAFILLILFDQWTKQLAVVKLKAQPDFILWDKVFQLHYLENRGAAFGMLQDSTIFFIFVAIVMMTVILFVLYKTPAKNKYLPWHIILVLIAAGGIGNMIDRIAQQYVVDFLYFSYINFAVFNVADCYVSVGTALMIIFILFVWKEEDLAFLNFQIRKNPKKEQ